MSLDQILLLPPGYGFDSSNAAPLITVPGAQAAISNVQLNITGVSISDANLSQNQTVTLSVLHGTLTIPNTIGLTFSVGDGANDSTMTFSATQFYANAALSAILYTSTTNYLGADTLSVTTNDGVVTVGPSTVAITVTWTPISLSPVVWLKQNTLLFSDAGTTPAVDTDPIYRWGDSSGNSNHANQVTLGNRPIYASGSGWASFTAASSHFMTITNSASIQWASAAPRTYAALLQLTATSSYPVISGKGTGSRDEFRFYDSGSKPDYATSGGVDGCTSTPSFGTGATGMITAVEDGAAIFLYIGSTQVGTDASSVPVANSNNLHIGSRGGTSLFCSMKLLEYVVMPTAITAPQLANLKTYWGV